ncbi:MAG: ADP-ribosylglycohydrolase family protein, partial [Chloroflexota bacterium]|nr:ADP-ribosylglycohydrolase family protein [Chloroflexota bacterium]
ELDLEAALVQIGADLIVAYWPWADLAPEAVAIAFAVFLTTGGDFVRAVPAAIRLGRDADTIGAIVGSLAGAAGGAQAIPDAWRMRVQSSTGACIGFVGGRAITDIADALAQQAGELQ